MADKRRHAAYHHPPASRGPGGKAHAFAVAGAVIALWLAGCGAPAIRSERPPSGPPPRGKLVFDDEFDGRGLDTRKWDWKYPREGERAYSNAPNGEAQWYTRANVTEGNGYLSLTARREPVRSPFSGHVFPYTSGLVQSKPSFNFEYGYIETRMWLPRGSGLWPAFWTWPSNEQWPPEIDVMEFHGQDIRHVHLTYHSTSGAASATPVHGPDWTRGWHTFGVEWGRGRLTWYVDGRARKTVDEAPALPMYLIANLAVSDGQSSPPPGPRTRFPAALRIDYIRVWRSGR